MKLYVLVRKDLSPSYQAVQAGHAVAEFCLKGPSTNWRNDTLIYLNVRDENQLYRWKNKLDRRQIKYAEFREPDIGDELTAISVVAEEKIFRQLRLM